MVGAMPWALWGWSVARSVGQDADSLDKPEPSRGHHSLGPCNHHSSVVGRMVVRDSNPRAEHSRGQSSGRASGNGHRRASRDTRALPDKPEEFAHCDGRR